MNTLELSSPTSFPQMTKLWDELNRRHPALARFGLLLLAAVPALALAMLMDQRELRGVNIWIKPIKFALAIGVYAWTLAWAAGYLRDSAWGLRRFRWLGPFVIVTGSFEFGYITLQAALGLGSHYNLQTVYTQVMYGLMGLGALGLTAASTMLATLLPRFARSDLPPVMARAWWWGLHLTFVLGAGVGMVLSGLQPPSGAGLPLFGWNTLAGDLRPAHFLGIHAQQILPLAAWLLFRHGARSNALRRLDRVAVAYGLFTAGLAALALLLR